MFLWNLVHHDEVLYFSSEASLLHDDHFLKICRRAKNGLHLSLAQNVVNLLLSHGVEESNSHCAVIHAGNKTAGPLPSILSPNSKESPLHVFPVDLWNQIKIHQTLGKALTCSIEFTICLPLVIAEDWVTLFILSGLWSCSKELSVSIVLHISSINLEESIHTFSERTWLSQEIVVIFWINFVANKLLGVPWRWLMVPP